MNRVQELSGPMKEKSGKKLIAFTVVTSLIAALFMFYIVLVINRYSKLKLLEEYVHEVPGIVSTREEELVKRSKVFEEDSLARGELGTFIYNEEKDLPVDERLEYICSTISADSVSLIDEKGEVLNTTGVVLPTDLFEEAIGNLPEGTPDLVFYPAGPDEEGDLEKIDGRAVVMFQVPGESGHRLVFEFNCDSYLYVYNALSKWTHVLERMLCGLPATAFVRVGEDDPIGFPLSEYSKEEREEISRAVTGIFEQKSRFFKLSDDTFYRLVTFRGEPSVGVMMPYPEKDAEILLIMPLAGYINSGYYSAGTLSIFIVFSLILFLLYVLRFCGQMHGKEDEQEFKRRIDSETRPGKILLILAVGVFTSMVLLLESCAAIAYFGATRRIALEYEIGWYEEQNEMSVELFSDIYSTRAKALAGLLERNSSYRTQSALQAFCNTLGAEYLMIFDKSGREIVSSNGYTGFTAGGPGANLDRKYGAMLLGYPSVVVGPSEDPYTNEQQIGAAALLTNEDSEPDGFLLAVFDADTMNKELEISSIENTVNTFAVTYGNMAALIDDEEGVFLAHTDQSKIGQEVKHYLSEDVYGTGFEGYTLYDGKSVYMSGDSDGEKTVLVMLPQTLTEEIDMTVVMAIAITLLVIAFLYCPIACRLCVRAMDELLQESENEEYVNNDSKSPLVIFVNGYANFVTVLSVFALYTAYTKKWYAFTFVFGGLWSRGINLFSLWAAMFYACFTLTVAIAVRRLIKDAQKRTSFRNVTVFKLLDSLLTYSTFIVLLIGVLYMFGVDTKALLASAGVVSIAVGMGAQTMIQDMIAGLFLAIEDSIHLGDVISVGEVTGRVTDMGIRTTTVTDENQNVMIINNSNISDVMNMSKIKTLCNIELTLDRSVSMTLTERIVKNAINEVSEEIADLNGSLKMEGFIGISNESFTVRLSFYCNEEVREDVTNQVSDLMIAKVAARMKDAAQ